MTDKTPTLCKDCKHSTPSEAWFGWECKKHPIAQYITGEPQAYGKCYTWNDKGTCVDYAPTRPVTPDTPGDDPPRVPDMHDRTDEVPPPLKEDD